MDERRRSLEDEYALKTRSFVRELVDQISHRFIAHNIVTGNTYFVGEITASQLLRNYSHYVVVTEIDWE